MPPLPVKTALSRWTPDPFTVDDACARYSSISHSVPSRPVDPLLQAPPKRRKLNGLPQPSDIAGHLEPAGRGLPGVGTDGKDDLSDLCRLRKAVEKLWKTRPPTGVS